MKLVADWLRGPIVSLPYFADIYLSAREMLEAKRPGYVVFVCHAGREIMNGIVRESLEETSSSLEYSQFVQEVSDLWQDRWGKQTLHQEAAKADTVREHSIPSECCQRIGRLIDEHRKATARKQNGSRRFFTVYLQYRDDQSIPADLMDRWSDARDWFSGKAHLGKRTRGDEERADELSVHFSAMERGLLAAARDTTGSLEQLDAILDATNR